MDPLWPPEPCMESFANLLAPAEQVPPCPISLTMPAVPQGCSLAPQGLPQGPGWLSLRTPPALTAFAVGQIQIATLLHLLTAYLCVNIWFPPDLGQVSPFPASEAHPRKARDEGTLARSAHCHACCSQNLIFIPETKGLSTCLTAQKTPNKK